MPHQRQNGLRPLRIEEDSLVRALLEQVSDAEPLLRQLTHARVRDLDDGGMGSLQFAADDGAVLGIRIVEAEYVDCDGVLVSIALNLDQGGRLFELDMWKVDFAPLLDYPVFARVTIKT